MDTQVGKGEQEGIDIVEAHFKAYELVHYKSVMRMEYWRHCEKKENMRKRKEVFDYREMH